MSTCRAVLLPTGMAMMFSVGRPVGATDPASPAQPRDGAEPAPESRAARVVGIRDGEPVAQVR